MATKIPAIGIDLGTTYSRVAVYEFGSVTIIPNENGHRKTPSYVAFCKNGRLLVGEDAKNQISINPFNTIYNIKRLIGRRFTDESVGSDGKNFSFNVVDKEGRSNVEVRFKDQIQNFSPEEITSVILLKMKEIAEAYLGASVMDAVISVPAYFNNAQRQATKNAGQIAGLHVLRIINETSASAIAYGLKNRAQGERNIMILDLGGGTLDVMIVNIDDGTFEVKSTCGNASLGGLDFDNRLVQYFVKEIKRKHRKDISTDHKAMRRLRNACEKVKQTLSNSNQAQIEIKSLISNVDFRSSITRTTFEQLCADLFTIIINCVTKTLNDSKTDESDINEILLVGGSSQMPKIRQMLQDFFNWEKLDISLNHDESVAYGAAIQAAMIKGDESGFLDDFLLFDVTSLTLCVDSFGETMKPLIKRNTPIPAKEIRNINAESMQQLNVSVYQGENKLVRDLVGKFVLECNPQQNKPVTLECSYEIDFNGILKVSAKIHYENLPNDTNPTFSMAKLIFNFFNVENNEKNTNNENTISFVQNGCLLANEIERMKVQISSYWEDDERQMYQKLAELEDVWKCVLNVKMFECPICFEHCKPGEGVVLRECLHIFCRQCLKGTIENNEEIQVQCPHQAKLGKCNFALQHREIKEIVSRESYERYLRLSLSVAEQQFENSFHCKTADCPGWCIFECAHFFDCPVCKHQNCINCQVIHEGKNCKQYQDGLMKAVHDEEAKKTKLHLEEQITKGLAMPCPKCKVIIMKIDGCDGVICTMCKMDICWATKGPRWGPGVIFVARFGKCHFTVLQGKGDTSGGCRCRVDGKRCHPNCRHCH